MNKSHKIIGLSVGVLLALSTSLVTTPVLAASNDNQTSQQIMSTRVLTISSQSIDTLENANYYKPLRIWITLGSYDYGPVHYFQYDGYRGYLQRITTERVGKGSTTLYRGYLYSSDVKSIPGPAMSKKINKMALRKEK